MPNVASEANVVEAGSVPEKNSLRMTSTAAIAEI